MDKELIFSEIESLMFDLDTLVKSLANSREYISENEFSRANTKLSEKNCDWIIANDVSKKDAGFNSDYNEVTIYYKDKKIQKENLSLKKKSEIAEEIVDRIVARIN